MERVSVLLVDDHVLLLESLSRCLEREPFIKSVLTARSADEAIEAARITPPDVVVMDIDMPGLIAFEAARRIRELHPDCRIVFLSAHSQDHHIEEALKVGASGYLTKSEPLERVVAAIRKVAEHGVSFSEEILRRLVFERDNALVTQSPSEAPAVDGSTRSSTLTPREREVLRYSGRGMDKKEIARVLHVAPRTIDKHTENLMRKLGIHDRVELVRFAIREGFVEP